MERIKTFVSENKDRDDMVGDLCKDLYGDTDFKNKKNDTERRKYIEWIGEIHPHTKESVTLFFEEYKNKY